MAYVPVGLQNPGDVDINGGSIDGVAIGADEAGAGTFAALSASGDITHTGTKVGLYSVTPTAQTAKIADPTALGTMTTVGANTGTSAAGLSLIGDTTTVNQASNLMNDLVALQEDIAAVKTAVDSNNSKIDAIIDALEAIGITAAA